MTWAGWFILDAVAMTRRRSRAGAAAIPQPR